MAYGAYREKQVEHKLQIKIPKSSVLEAYRDYLMDFSTRHMVFYGGAGSGKSFFVSLKVIITLLQSKRKCIVARKFGTTIEDSVMADILNQLEMLKILKYCKVNKSSRKITLPNGSMILFKALDDEHKVKSINGISLIWVEEATDIDKEIFDQLCNRLRAPQDLLPGQEQQIILSFNPVSKSNWCYKEFFDMGTPENPGLGALKREDSSYKIIHTNYMDNPTLPQSFLDTILGYKRNNPFKYEVYALGKFASLGKLVIDSYKVAKLDEWELSKNPELEAHNGIDFGWNDTNVILYSYANIKERKMYIYRTVYKNECKIADLYELIKRSGGLRKQFFADSSRPETIRELYDLGIDIQKAKKGHGSIMDGISYINDFEIIVDESCKELIEEFENYAYKKDKSTGEYLDIPEQNSGWDHGVDALRYAYSYRAFGVKPTHRPY